MVNQNNNETNDFSQVSWQEIDEHSVGQRIDNFLMRILKGVPKSRVYRILRKGEVRVNKKRAKPDYKLKLGDQLRIPPIRVAQKNDNELILPAWVRAAIDQPIFEDEAMIAINKPSGLAVHGGSGIEFGLIEAMRQLKPDWPFLELVHRIDRETSGCILLAKSRTVLNELHTQFRREAGQVGKSYLALLSGDLSEITTVNSALLQSRDEKGMKRVNVDESGQSAKSTFMPLETFKQASYVRIQLYTGRMHQARVHAASLDLPILGDKIYGDWEANRAMKPLGVKRCMLHAERYQLNHPLTGKLVQFKAPMPEDFERALQALSE
ncbi:MAG: RluA family pseudouridine synthase [Arenicellales bacterium]